MFLRLILLAPLFFAAGCSAVGFGGKGGNNAVGVCQATPGNQCVANVPVCGDDALGPFVPVGTAFRVSQIPAGSYRYIGGDIYAETTNLTPNSKIGLRDTEPDDPKYPGTLLCITNLSSNIPNFDTSGAISRNVQVTNSQFAFTGLRRASGSFQNGTLQTLIFSQNDFRTQTPVEVEQDQQGKEARGYSINVYRLSPTEFKIVIIRTVSGFGVNANLFIAARYSYTP